MVIDERYFYENEANQFQFYRIPQELFTPKFKNLDTMAKVLYGILLDRNSLSISNNWTDDDGKVFIYYDREDLKDMLQIGKGLLIRYFKQLQEFDLIDIKRQGQGKPNKYYVKKFIPKPKENTDYSSTETVATSCFAKKSKKQTSKSPEKRFQEVSETDTNKTNNNNTDMSNKSVSREQEEKTLTDGLTDIFDRCELQLFNTDVNLKLFLETVITDLYTKSDMCIKLKMGLRFDEIRERVSKLSLSHIDRALQKYRSVDVKKNPHLYFSKCLLTSVVEIGIEDFNLLNSVDFEE